jgi:hypothetical protein
VAGEVDVFAGLNLEKVEVLEPPEVSVELITTIVQMWVFFK